MDHPDNPTNEEPADPRLAELEEMGLFTEWLLVAREIGYEKFLTMWRILDEINHGQTRDAARLYVPCWSSYLRLQRNKAILSMRESGLRPDEIQANLIKEFGKAPSLCHIKRLTRRQRA